MFGEQLNDRVINVANPESDNNNSSADGADGGSNDANKDESTEPKSTSNTLWPLNSDAANEDALEQNDANTIAKFNCKLYVLETDKVNWAERGYGIMKLIDSNDGQNCKLSKYLD